MAIFTLALMPVMLVIRVKAVRSGAEDIEYFKVFKGPAKSEKVAQSGRHISNLFEVPTLFYVACLTILLLQIDDKTFAILGFTYFALRIVHSFVHLTYNKLLHRMIPFIISNIVLIITWVRIAILSS